MKKNIIEKIWDSHIVAKKEGHPYVFSIDLLLMHEVTSAQAFDTVREKNLKIPHPEKIIATIDHSTPTDSDRKNIKDEIAKNQVETMRKNAKEFGITFFDFDSGNQGIVHVIGPELGLTKPGMTICCGDSHTSTDGAFGALAFGIGTSEVGHILASSCLLQEKPKTFKVEFRGKMKKGVFSKDLILKLISKILIGGANGHIIEFCGEVISAMSMEERMTICNMAIECGARAGLISPDEKTFEYIKGKRFAPKGEDWQKSLENWKKLESDEGCEYDKEIILEIGDLNPMITWGINPEQGIEITENLPKISDLDETKKLNAKKSYEYTKLKEGEKIEGEKIDWAFLGSCTNGRIEDLRICAKILEGKKVNENVIFYIVPGSEVVRKQAIEEGLDKIFEKSGAIFRMPGCSLCLGMNDDKVPEGKRCISSLNRNFIGRQGKGSFTHLASPATVSASAIEGKITNPAKYL